MPRPDNVELWDEQTAALESTARVTIILGGTGSGKTTTAAVRTARYLLSKPAPREDTPFWIVGESYDLACGVCWKEKLRHFIPESAIKKISWMDQGRGHPRSVILNDIHDTGTNWTIDFKSYAQGRENFQAASIGGWWCNEEVPYSIIEEIFGRCRDYDSPGWADFTPLEVRSPEWPDIYDQAGVEGGGYEDWSFFHLNTECNDALAPGWAQKFLAKIPEDMRETRRKGVFSTFKGAVFKEFRKGIHVVKPLAEIPNDWKRRRSIDFGFRNPTAVLWGAEDRDGRWWIYDEHYEAEQTIKHHADKIKERAWPNHPLFMKELYGDHDAQDRHEYLQHGIRIKPAVKDIVAGIETVRRLMMVDRSGKPALFITSNCVNLIAEIMKYRWPDSTGTRNPSDLPVDKDNHAIDALRYMVHSDKASNGGTATIVTPKDLREWRAKSERYF